MYGFSILFWKEWWGTSFSLRYFTTALYESELNVCNFRPLVEALHSKREDLVSSLILIKKLLKFSSDSMNIGGGFGRLITVGVCGCSLTSMTICESSSGGANGVKRFAEVKMLVSFFEIGEVELEILRV